MEDWTLKQLEVLVAATEEREPRRIQARLGRSRQAVEQLFETLFKTRQCDGAQWWISSQGGRPIWPFELTPLGRELLPSIRAMLRQNELARTLADSLRNEQQGRVSIGGFSVHEEMFLAELIEGFRLQEPLIHIDLKRVLPEASPEVEWELFAPLREGVIDLVFGGEQRWGFNHFVMYTTSVVAAVHAEHPWRGRRGVEVEELLGEPLLMLPKGYFSRDRMVQILASHGLDGPTREALTARGLQKLHAAGIGIPILGDDAVDRPDPPFPSVLLNGEPIRGDMCVHWRQAGRPMGAATTAFLDYVRKAMPGRGGSWS